MSRLKAVALGASGALASMLFCGWLIVGHIRERRGRALKRAKRATRRRRKTALAIVVDRPIAEGNSMPLWLSDRPAMGLHNLAGRNHRRQRLRPYMRGWGCQNT